MSECNDSGCDVEKTPVQPLHGLLLIDKPPGPTSYDCIRFIRRTCAIPSNCKIGHFGTLDPFAAGVLIVALGRAVRYAEYALALKKKYRARLYLGDETDTLDPTGNVTASSPVPEDWYERLQSVRGSFIGVLQQTPPAFSAKHIEGKRSYRLARADTPAELSPVAVQIFSLEFGAKTSESWIDFIAEVSSGTYIRSLARDLARAIGTVGHLVGLERLAVGPYTIEESIPLTAIEVGGAGLIRHHLYPIDGILAHLRQCEIHPESEAKLVHGGLLTPDDCADGFPVTEGDRDIVRIVDRDGRFLALGRVDTARTRVVPFKQWVE